MGGIGKTMLARNVYEHLLIVQHFDVRVWATISQGYSVKQILLELFSCLCEQCSSEDTEDQLGEKLYKSLSGRRYLIILDDMWSIEVWEKIRLFIPENCNRSRIVITTRLSNVATHFGSSCLAMKFLDGDKNWSLFFEKKFGQEGCPPELEEIGRKIVEKCKGLPLSIVVIGGLLGKYRTQGFWENVAKDTNSILNSGEDDDCFSILFLSYRHLPAHLKPCFLHLGHFPELDHKIHASRLVKLWVAEGFLRPNKPQVLEEVAEGYLKDLVVRNLILVSRWGLNGKIKTFNIHDLLRDFCLRIAEKEKFFHVTRLIGIPRGVDKERFAFHEPIQLNHHPHFLIFKRGVWSNQFRLVRILNAGDAEEYPIFQQVNLRHLTCIHTGRAYLPTNWFMLPSSMSLLWNVQTLRIKGFSLKLIAPPEIWEMPQLRHLEIDNLFLSNPPSNQQDGSVLQNLQTLSEVLNLSFSEEVCERIPNVKKLHVTYGDFNGECKESSCYRLHNLGRLHKLKSLICSFSIWPNWDDLLQSLTFPSSLQKLSLKISSLHWEDLKMIGSLPHLEVLELICQKSDGELIRMNKSVVETEWSPDEGEFRRLKSLMIYGCDDLIHWSAGSSHFPVLENLILSYAFNLAEIPSGIGEIPTLRCVNLSNCSLSAAVSALRMLVEQEELGNEGFLLGIYFLHQKEQQASGK